MRRETIPAICLPVLFLSWTGCSRDIREQWPDDARGRARVINQCMSRGQEHLEKGRALSLTLEERLEELEEAQSYFQHAVKLDPDGCGTCVWALAEVYDTQARYVLREARERPELRERGLELLRGANHQYEAFLGTFYPLPVEGLEWLVFARLGDNYRLLGDYRMAKRNFVRLLNEAGNELLPEIRELYEEFIRQCDERIEREGEEEELNLGRR